jgi:hypothetical protein
MKKQIIKQFGSIADMRDWINSPTRLEGNEKFMLSLREYNHDRTWYGFKNYATALSAISDGDPIGALQISTLTQKLKTKLPRAQGHKRVKFRGDEGDELDIDAVYRGDLSRAWEGTRREVRRGSGIIRIMVDIGGNSCMSADELRWRGIAGVALSEIITKAGYSVEITAGSAVTNVAESTDAAWSVAIKSRNAKSNLGRLSAAIGSPALFRTLGFDALVKCADENNKLAKSNLGRYTELSSVLPVPQTVTQLMVPGMVTSETSAIDWIKQSIQLLQGA